MEILIFKHDQYVLPQTRSSFLSQTKCYYPESSLRLFKGLISSEPFVPTAGYSTFGTDCRQSFQFTLLQEKSNPCPSWISLGMDLTTPKPNQTNVRQLGFTANHHRVSQSRGSFLGSQQQTPPPCPEIAHP